MKINRLPLTIATVVLSLGLLSCTTTQPDMTYKPAPPQPKQLGSVAFANSAEGFVLVNMNYGYTAEPGTSLYAMDGGVGTARLVVTPQSQKQFVVANIEKGQAVAGQPVFFFPEPDKAPRL